MDRRGFLQVFIKGVIAVPLVSVVALAMPHRVVVVQQSPIAGFQYYAGGDVFSELQVNTPFLLEREPNNKYDSNAVAIYYKQYKLGFIPRADNTAVAQMLDRGEKLSAKIVKLSMSKDPWERVRFEVTLNG